MSGEITFYSTKRSSNVAIPRNKVCGYRIKNPMMKKGYSDGMRADRENGVVEQRLSRYATEDERKCAGSNCEGNTNWLNHRKVNFNTPESADNQFWIKRPAFKEGTVDNTQTNADPIPKNIREGLGNRDITRNNFLAPAIKARFTGDFDKLQALDISEVGKPEGITDNKLGYFTNIKVPDPNDFKWLREKARLEAEYTTRFTNAGFPANEIPAMVARELEINKPLGRAQRTINRSSDSISTDARLNTKEKLREIIQEVQQGRAEGQAGRVAITAQLIQIFADTQAIGGLTQLQLQGLGQALARIGVPTNYKRLGLIPRFVDITFYNANAGMINLLLFSKVRETPNNNQYNYDRMVLNFTGAANGLPAITLRSAVSAMGRGGADRRYLDLERGGVIDRFELRRVAGAQGGFVGPNFDIQVGNQ
jgi:hypothetical protein